MLNVIRNLKQDESGQDLIEYALIAALIALAAVTSMGVLGNNPFGWFAGVSNKLGTPPAGS